MLDGLYKGWSDSAVSAVDLRTLLWHSHALISPLVGVFTCDSYIKSACNLSILTLWCFLFQCHSFCHFFIGFFCDCHTNGSSSHLLTTGLFNRACCATSDATCHLYTFHRSIIGGQSCFLSETGDKQYFSK